MADPRRLLEAVGQALYGARFQTELAHALGVTDRTMRRWLSGETAPAVGVWWDLVAVMDERAAALGELRGRVMRLSGVE